MGVDSRTEDLLDLPLDLDLLFLILVLMSTSDPAGLASLTDDFDLNKEGGLGLG